MPETTLAKPVARKKTHTSAEKSASMDTGSLVPGTAAGMPLFLQRLQVNEPGDAFEQEADAVARRVSQAGREAAPARTLPSSAGILRSPDNGSPLSETIRSRIEPVLGADLKSVRVHANSEDRQKAGTLNARAFTHKNHIWLGPNESADDTTLLAHEATHVLHQSDGSGPGGTAGQASAIQRQETSTATPPTEVPPGESAFDRARPLPISAEQTDDEEQPPAEFAQTLEPSPAGAGAAEEAEPTTAGPGAPEIPAAATGEEEAATGEGDRAAGGETPAAPEGERASGETAAETGGDSEADSEGAGTSALIDEELAEHERWAGSFGEMGTAGSDERAQFLLNQAGQGATTGATSGAVMGLVMGTIGAAVGQIAGRRLATLAVSRGLSAAPVPGLGAAIGGVMAVAGLAMRDWGATAHTIGIIGEGEGYEGLANDLEGVAEILDVACSVMDVLAGVLGGIAVGMWIGAVLSAGVLSPLAASLSAIAVGINFATTAVGIIINVAVRPTVLALRALHAFQSQGDPTEIEAQGQVLQGAAGQITGAVAGHLAGKLGGAAGTRLGGRAYRAITRFQAGRRGDTPAMSARAGPGPRLHVEMPEAPARVEGEGAGPARPPATAEGPAPTARPAATDGPAAAAPGRPVAAEGEGSRRSRRVAASEESFGDAEFDAIMRDIRNSELGYDLEASQRRAAPTLQTDTTRTRAQVDTAAHGAARRNPPPGQVAGAQIQHQTKTLDVTRDLPAGMAPLHPDVINENLMWLQSSQTLPSTELHVDPAGRGTRHYIDDVPRGRRGDAGMPGEQLDLFTPSRGPRDPNYNTEHKFMDNFLIPRESERIASSRRQAGLPPLDPRMLAIAAGEQARFIVTGRPGTERSGRMIDLAAQATARPSGPTSPSAQTELNFGPARPADATSPAASSPVTGTAAAPRSAYASHTETARTTDRAAAMAQYHDQVRSDPGRESGVWRGADGSYYVMQGDAGSVSPPAAAGPLELIYHSHPTESDAAMQGLVTQPSQAAGDIGVLQDQHGQGPAGRRQTSELHFPVYDEAGNHTGYGSTQFAYDPTHPLPLQVETTSPGGQTSTQRYASFDDFQSRTGIQAGGATPSESVAAGMAADVQLRQDTSAARQRIDETAGTLTGPTLYARRAREPRSRTPRAGGNGSGRRNEPRGSGVHRAGWRPPARGIHGDSHQPGL